MIAAACGGDDISGLIADSGVDGTTEGGDLVDATPADDTGTGGDGSAQDSGDGAPSTDSGDATTGSDAGSDAPTDVTLIPDSGNTVADAAPGGDAAAVNCGSADCNLPTQTCCIYPITNAPPPFYLACSTGASCPALDSGVYDAGTPTELQCEVQANCSGGQICCIYAPSSGKIGSHCTTENSCANSAGTKTAQLCNPAAIDAGCGDAGACSSTNIGTWHLPNGFGTCGGKANNN